MPRRKKGTVTLECHFYRAFAGNTDSSNFSLLRTRRVSQQFVLFPSALLPYARSMMLRQEVIFDMPFLSLPRETSTEEKRKKGKIAEERSRFQSASFRCLDFLELIPIAPCPPSSIRLFSLIPVLCSYLFFFLAPEGNTEHLLREIKKKRLSPWMLDYEADDAQEDEPTIAAAVFSFPIYWLLAHAIRSII